jgi:hypothetical protein
MTHLCESGLLTGECAGGRVGFGECVGIAATPTESPYVVSYLDLTGANRRGGQGERRMETIAALSPRRVILKPGTESPTIKSFLASRGTEAVEGCTLVMLSTGTF